MDVLIRPEELRIAAAPGGNGIVTMATFLGSLTRISVLLSGDVTVRIDVPSVESAALAPGTSVNMTVAQAEVLVTGAEVGPKDPAGGDFRWLFRAAATGATWREKDPSRRPPCQAMSLDHAGLETLYFDTCLRLLASVPVGRVGFVADGEVQILPVNHLVDGQDVVFRTAYGSKLSATQGSRRSHSRPTTTTSRRTPGGASSSTAGPSRWTRMPRSSGSAAAACGRG